ncbi:MAG: GNAT family N-acetyltransferase [Candidatus Cloacimonetes bacterium]|nr:GNAT family N-acetyltransferase [Candidatus Cloacimonadota bacterium]
MEVLNKTIYGKRIKLRKLCHADAQDIFNNIHDNEVSKNTPLKLPYNYEDCIAYIDRSTLNPAHKEFGIQHYDSKEIIGVISIYNYTSKLPFIGYWLTKKFRKLGYAQESLELLIKYCNIQLRLKKIEATVFDTNLASIELLKRNGFNYTKSTIVSKANSSDEQTLEHYCFTEAIAST